MKKRLLNSFSEPLADEILKVSTVKYLDKEIEFLRTGQFIRAIPFVIDGRVKVYSVNADKELFLYYIQPVESCIMSFSAYIENQPSKVSAVTETKTTLVLLPVSKINSILKEFPDFGYLYYKLYYERYTDLIERITSTMFDSIETRVLNYLQKKKEIEYSDTIEVTHKQIALDLGSSREVISRTLKKIEQKNKIKLYNSKIKLL
jgi:CRP/FNR family transcriptional regulator